MALHDGFGWFTATSAHPVRILRTGWVSAVLLIYLALALLSAPLLPDGVPVRTAYLPTAVLAFSVAVMGR